METTPGRNLHVIQDANRKETSTIMAQSKIIISYNQKLKRVRACFPIELCLTQKKPDRDIFKRAKEKFDLEKNLGNIEEYELFEDSFHRTWSAIRKLEPKNLSKMMEVTIGQGARIISGIYAYEGKGDELIQISIKTKLEKIRSITWNCFYFNLHRTLNAANITGRPHEGMIRAIFKRAQDGEVIKRCPIKIQPSLKERTVKGLTFTINKQLQEGYAIIFDEQLINSSSQIEQMLSRCRKAYHSMAGHIPQLKFLEEEVKRQIVDLQHSPESLGLGLPRVILLGYVRAQVATSNNATYDLLQGARKAQDNTKAFDIEISQDKLLAKVGNMTNQQIKSLLGEVNPENLEAILEKKGITYGFIEFIDRIVHNINNGITVKGMTLAKGLLPEPGEQSYIHLTYKEKQNLETQPHEAVDIRKLQNRNTVRAGGIIAELRYQDGKSGSDIFGKKLFSFASQSQLELQIGENVRFEEPGIIRSTIDGMPIIEGNKIACSPLYIHEGDVNLSSGNIEFDGNVVVEGNIDSGALVITKGDLLVNGRIGPSNIHCRGNIKVEGGILTGEKGWIDCLGSIEAEFIENSRISSAGNIHAQTSIINSEIICGKNLETADKDNGRIAGGQIKVNNIISTGNLGFGRGPKTSFSLGGDWKKEKKKAILTHRLEKILQFIEIEDRKQKDLSALKRPTQDKKNLLIKIKEKIERASRIQEKIKLTIHHLSANVVWNNDARVEIYNELVDNLEVKMGGKTIQLKGDMKGVLIVARAVKGNRIHPIEDLDSFRLKEEKAS